MENHINILHAKRHQAKRAPAEIIYAELGFFNDFIKIGKVLPEVALRYPLPFQEQQIHVRFLLRGGYTKEHYKRLFIFMYFVIYFRSAI